MQQSIHTSSASTDHEADRTARMLTPGELARFLVCSERHIYNLRQRGMPAYRVGDIIRFDLNEVRRWLDGNRTSESGPREQS
jgi:excisionase family DNA binding protein